MEYNNLHMQSDIPEFNQVVHNYFKKETVTIGQITRKLLSFMRTLVRTMKFSQTFHTEFSIHWTGEYRSELLIQIFDEEMNALMYIAIEATHPNAYLYPFFRVIWDEDPYFGNIPIESSEHTILSKLGSYTYEKELLNKKEPFAIMTFSKYKPKWREKMVILAQTIFSHEKEYLNDYTHTLRPSIHRPTSHVIDAILRRTGKGYIVKPTFNSGVSHVQEQS